jgi:2-dehydro-3-deoxyphosphogluconate aldolase/(4S)-4-hydroxy-2-oxoglutarate aldolase
MVKVFPTSGLGASYIRDLKGPLPQIKLLPTGGVNLDTVAEFIRAGSSAVGVGTALVSKEALRQRDFTGIRATAAEFLKRVQAARQGG